MTCLPQDLPDAIEVDMLNVNLGEIVHLADLVAPKGVEFTALAHENNIAVASVQEARVNVVEDEEQDQPADAAAEGEAEEK